MCILFHNSHHYFLYYVVCYSGYAFSQHNYYFGHTIILSFMFIFQVLEKLRVLCYIAPYVISCKFFGLYDF